MNIARLHNIFLNCNAVCTDTRKIQNNDLFFALKGDNFNGNQFAAQALEKGAAYAVIDEAEFALDDRCILVDDALNTLQELAQYHRRYLGIKIVALTGSNGKTTTKELIHAVLKQQYNTVATKGNLNNHIGVPLTLLSMDKSTEIGIVEMGANHLKEIEFLCNIAEPDYGYITNFGKAHLEGFGSIEGVIKGKSELYDHLKAHNKLIFINGADARQLIQLGDYSNYFDFSNTTNAKATIELSDAHPFVQVKYKALTIQSHLIGAYNFYNISAAIAIGQYFEISPEAIKTAIEGYVPDNNRSQIIDRGSNKIILDAYNANPSSMKAALDNFSLLEAVNKIAILGDMFELGNDSAIEHQTIADYANNLTIHRILLVGENFYGIQTDSEKIVRYETFDQLEQALFPEGFQNTTFLIKGSRGMALERVLGLI